MAQPIRIVGHTNPDGTTNEGLQAQVETDGSLRTELLKNYKCCNMDTSSDPSYYGFTDKDENWYIIELDEGNGTIKYCKGSGSYAVAWAAAGSQSYDYFFSVF